MPRAFDDRLPVFPTVARHSPPPSSIESESSAASQALGIGTRSVNRFSGYYLPVVLLKFIKVHSGGQRCHAGLTPDPLALASCRCSLSVQAQARPPGNIGYEGEWHASEAALRLQVSTSRPRPRPLLSGARLGHGTHPRAGLLNLKLKFQSGPGRGRPGSIDQRSVWYWRIMHEPPESSPAMAASSSTLLLVVDSYGPAGAPAGTNLGIFLARGPRAPGPGRRPGRRPGAYRHAIWQMPVRIILVCQCDTDSEFENHSGCTALSTTVHYYD